MVHSKFYCIWQYLDELYIIWSEVQQYWLSQTNIISRMLNKLIKWFSLELWSKFFISLQFKKLYHDSDIYGNYQYLEYLLEYYNKDSNDFFRNLAFFKRKHVLNFLHNISSNGILNHLLDENLGIRKNQLIVSTHWRKKAHYFKIYFFWWSLFLEDMFFVRNVIFLNNFSKLKYIEKWCFNFHYQQMYLELKRMKHYGHQK
jgi:hypothetical protein